MTLISRRWLALGAAVITASTALAGCSSSKSGAGTGGGSSASSSDVSLAQQKVAALEAATSSYPVPTASVSGVSKFSGRTVYYIPLVQAIPGFVVTAATMKDALGEAGLKQQACDGQGTPSNMAGCVQQAVAAHAAGIVLDAIPYGMVQNALDAAKAAGIPIIIADQFAPSGNTDDDHVSYVPGATDQPSDIAWWMIADSKGSGKIVVAEESDSPSSKHYVTNALPIFSKYCPGCTVILKSIAATDSQVSSDTASDVLSNPGVGYFYTEFEDSLHQTIAGLQQAGKVSSVKLSVAGGSVDGLGLLKAGSDGVSAVVAVDQAYAGYALTDEILRMVTGAAPVDEPFPTRLFTKDNIGSVEVTTAAQAPVFAAVFLGTAVVEPGRFNPIGTFIGIYFLATGILGLQLLGLQEWINNVFYGGVLVAAVTVATVLRKRVS